MQDNPILTYTEGIAISQNLACKILHIGKIKAKALLVNKKIRLIPSKGAIGYNLSDVLSLVGKNISTSLP